MTVSETSTKGAAKAKGKAGAKRKLRRVKLYEMAIQAMVSTSGEKCLRSTSLLKGGKASPLWRHSVAPRSVKKLADVLHAVRHRLSRRGHQLREASRAPNDKQKARPTLSAGDIEAAVETEFAAEPALRDACLASIRETETLAAAIAAQEKAAAEADEAKKAKAERKAAKAAAKATAAAASSK